MEKLRDTVIAVLGVAIGIGLYDIFIVGGCKL